MVHYTYKGRSVDMQAMLMMNEHQVALGNANMNARGDIIGTGGSIVRTAEDIATEYYQQNASVAVETDEDIAIDFSQPVMETFDSSLLTGYDKPEEPDFTEIDAPAPRRKAPTVEAE